MLPCIPWFSPNLLNVTPFSPAYLPGFFFSIFSVEFSTISVIHLIPRTLWFNILNFCYFYASSHFPWSPWFFPFILLLSLIYSTAETSVFPYFLIDLAMTNALDSGGTDHRAETGKCEKPLAKPRNFPPLSVSHTLFSLRGSWDYAPTRAGS